MPSAITIPSDFPSAHRLGDAALFRELLGVRAKSTFSHLLARGLLPAPDKKVGRQNRWYETTMAKAVKALPTVAGGRPERAAGGQHEQAVAQ
jgi:hypothetical protein